jgi:hypothetical protein
MKSPFQDRLAVDLISPYVVEFQDSVLVESRAGSRDGSLVDPYNISKFGHRTPAIHGEIDSSQVGAAFAFKQFKDDLEYSTIRLHLLRLNMPHIVDAIMDPFNLSPIARTSSSCPIA